MMEFELFGFKFSVQDVILVFLCAYTLFAIYEKHFNKSKEQFDTKVKEKTQRKMTDRQKAIDRLLNKKKLSWDERRKLKKMLEGKKRLSKKESLKLKSLKKALLMKKEMSDRKRR